MHRESSYVPVSRLCVANSGALGVGVVACRPSLSCVLRSAFGCGSATQKQNAAFICSPCLKTGTTTGIIGNKMRGIMVGHGQCQCGHHQLQPERDDSRGRRFGPAADAASGCDHRGGRRVDGSGIRTSAGRTGTSGRHHRRPAGERRTVRRAQRRHPSGADRLRDRAGRRRPAAADIPGDDGRPVGRRRVRRRRIRLATDLRCAGRGRQTDRRHDRRLPAAQTPCPATFTFRRTVWETCGGYDESMRSGFEDWDFCLSLLTAAATAADTTATGQEPPHRHRPRAIDRIPQRAGNPEHHQHDHASGKRCAISSTSTMPHTPPISRMRSWASRPRRSPAQPVGAHGPRTPRVAGEPAGFARLHGLAHIRRRRYGRRRPSAFRDRTMRMPLTRRRHPHQVLEGASSRQTRAPDGPVAANCGERQRRAGHRSRAAVRRTHPYRVTPSSVIAMSVSQQRTPAGPAVAQHPPGARARPGRRSTVAGSPPGYRRTRPHRRWSPGRPAAA